jgi:hypothetical protein
MAMIKRLFRQGTNHQYPLMRDPQRNPKCYELTDQEREEATRRVDNLLRRRAIERASAKESK